MSENEATTSTMDPPVKINEEILEPETKRRKITTVPDEKLRLVERLGGILCCAVCLDLPKAAVYQGLHDISSATQESLVAPKGFNMVFFDTNALSDNFFRFELSRNVSLDICRILGKVEDLKKSSDRAFVSKKTILDFLAVARFSCVADDILLLTRFHRTILLLG